MHRVLWHPHLMELLTLEQTDGGLPRSALRYRPTAADTITVNEYITSAKMPVLQVQRASRLRQPQAIDEEGKQEVTDDGETSHDSTTARKARRTSAIPTTLPHTPQPKKTTRPRARLPPCSSSASGCWLPSP